MALGQPTRPRYQRLAQPHQTLPGEFYLTAPPNAIPTGNPPILVPRQQDGSSAVSGSDEGSGSSGPSSEPQDSSELSPSPTSEPPSTTTQESPSTQPPSTSESPSTTPPSTTSRESSSSSSERPSTSSHAPSITPTSSETSGLSSSTSLTFSPDTTITSPVVLTINGLRTTSYVLVPTTLGDPGNKTSSSERTAIIAGSVTGGVVFVLLVAAIILFYRRHQNKKKGFFPTSEPKPRTMLLAGEDLDDEYIYSRQTSNAPTPVPSSVRRVESPVNSIPRSISADQTPRLLRPRASDTGSIFHEGGIWPPPSNGSKLVDPILAGSHINLSNIINDVMGSSTGQQPNASGSNVVIRPRGGNRPTNGDTSPVHSEDSIYSTDLPVPVPNQRQGHGQDTSTNSEAPLIPPEPLYLASAHNSGSSPSILSSRYESGFDPSRSSTSINNPHGTRSWLDRSPRKMSDSPSNPFNRTPSPFVPDNGRLS